MYIYRTEMLGLYSLSLTSTSNFEVLIKDSINVARSLHLLDTSNLPISAGFGSSWKIQHCKKKFTSDSQINVLELGDV